MSATDADAHHFGDFFDRLSYSVERFIKGKREAVRLALICMFAEGHLLIEDVPGVAKTSLAKAIARSIAGGTVKRVQFTPDLLPSDVTGVQIFDQRTQEFTFRGGPVFTNILLADEINRAAPKTQSALLEVMAERQVTVDGTTYPVARPFLCIATQNPLEHHGTFVLPEAQVDRFMMMIKLGYPDHAAEVEVVRQGVSRLRPENLEPVLSFADVNRMTDVAREVHVADAIADYVVSLVSRTRDDPDRIQLGASPRASVALAQAAQAHAAAERRAHVYEADVRAVLFPVLRHRLVLAPEAELQGVSIDDVLRQIWSAVPAPTARAR